MAGLSIRMKGYEKMKIRQLLLMMVITTLGLVGCSNSEAMETVSAETTEVARESIEVFGVVKSNDVRSVNVDVELKVMEVIKKTGDSVLKNDRILRFDKALIDRQLDIYKQELALITSKMNKSDITTLQIRNSLSEANTSLKIAEEKYSNDQVLVTNGIISKSDLDQSKEVYSQMVSRVKDLKLSIEMEEVNNTISDQESILAYNKLSKKIESIENILNNKEIIYEDYLVSHLDSGVVTELDLLAGDYITPKTNIYKLADNEDLYIEAEVSEEFISEISIGQEVQITPLFDKSKTIIGTVEKINGLPFIKNGETIVIIEIAIEDTEGFMPNFNVDVTIYVD